MFAVREAVSERGARAVERFERVRREMERLQTESLALLAELERERIHEPDGHLSLASWLVSRFHMGWGAANEQIEMARALEQMPRARQALQQRAISSCALQRLVRARQVDPEAFARSEDILVDAARTQPITALNKVLGRWRLLAEQERYPNPEERFQARRGFWVSPTIEGMFRSGGDLTPEIGGSLLTALSAVMDAEAHAGSLDERTPSQRRHDALGVIVSAFLDSSDRPSVGGERPHLNVTVDLETLTAASGTAEAEHVGSVSAVLARQIACDASVRRMVLGPNSQPLDVGRATPVIPAALRRAVIARDRTCAFPSCDRPSSWCEAHHVWHWADGGPTALGNLVLLCQRHHTLVHAGGFATEMVDGRPVFRRPDRSVVEDRGPP